GGTSGSCSSSSTCSRCSRRRRTSSSRSRSPVRSPTSAGSTSCSRRPGSWTGGRTGRRSCRVASSSGSRSPARSSPGRRADGQPRLEDGRRGPRAAPPLGLDLRADDGDGHARAARRRDRRPDPLPRRRADRARAAHDDRRAGARGHELARRVIGVALKGLLGRKLRAALTATAIVLGVAMISGTYVLTDTIKAAFTTVFTQVYKNTDAVITGKSAIGGNANNGDIVPSLPESLLVKVRAAPGV